MTLLLVNQSRDRVYKAWLAKWLKALSRQLMRAGFKGLTRKELVVVFVSSGEMRRLNRLYRRKDYATDVLSFAPAEEASVGELVLCLPVIRAQSCRSGLSARAELGYMLVHGVLHLLGYDHLRPVERADMFALQDELFTRLCARVGLS